MLIKLKDLTKEYKDASRTLRIIDSLNYEFDQDTPTAIVGRSGVGKSTLLNLLGGLDRPSSGKVYFRDQDLSALDQNELAEFRGAKVSFIFQFHYLLPEFDSVENVAMPLFIVGEEQTQARAKAEELLKLVGLRDRLHHRPNELSGGEQQRVAIARALIRNPDLVLADEPTGNLDENTAHEVYQLIDQLVVQNKRKLIIVTHNMDLAKSFDLVLEMKTGGKLDVL